MDYCYYVVTYWFKTGNNPGLQIYNTSLPENVTVSEGEDALFLWGISYSQQNWHVAAESLFNVEITIPIAVGNRTTYSFCSEEYRLLSDWNSTNCSVAIVTRKMTNCQRIECTVMFSIRLSKVTADLNGSTVACSYIDQFSNTLQWKRVARLTVKTTAIIEAPVGSGLIVSILVPLLVVVFVSGTAVILVIGTVRIIKKKRRYLKINADEGMM